MTTTDKPDRVYFSPTVVDYGRCIERWKEHCEKMGLIFQQPDKELSRSFISEDGTQLFLELWNAKSCLATFTVTPQLVHDSDLVKETAFLLAFVLDNVNPAEFDGDLRTRIVGNLRRSDELGLFDWSACVFAANREQAETLHLTPPETAARLRVSMSTLANWRADGLGPTYIKFGRKILYPITELKVFEHARLKTSTSDKGKK